ncbi:FYN-binding protein 2 [Mustela lutreola]|uniref:FYN-binding protein 2 n=1 Tax=Mustela lutreola TaxID=9666 RepID=UPI002797B8D9|nr:FYN-binding protein 2 [Mustela lutreola]
MECGRCPASAGKAPVPREGGAAPQVGQVGHLSSGVSRALGGDCSLASANKPKRTLGPRIQLWETAFVSQTLPRRKAMEGEGLRNFKELRAKFQKFDMPLPPGPIKFSAGVSQKGNIGNTQSTRILANGKSLSSSHSLLPLCSSAESQLLKDQETKLAQRSEIQKCSNSPGSLERSSGPAVNSQKSSPLLDRNPSNAEITNKRRVTMNESFKDKLWNWEKFSSQKSESSSASLLARCACRICHAEEQKSRGLLPKEPRIMLEIKGTQTLPSQRHLVAQRESLTFPEDPTFLLFQHGKKSLENPLPEKSPVRGSCQLVYESELSSQAPDSEKQSVDKHQQLLKTKPLPSIESLGPPPPKPPKPPVVNLQAFQKQAATISKTHTEAAVEEGCLPPESAEFEEPHNYEATISYLKHSGNSINLCTAKEIADSTYEVEIEEPQKPRKNGLHQELSPKYEDEDEDKKEKEKEPCELQPQKPQKDLPSSHLFKGATRGGMLGRKQVMKVLGGRRSMLPRKQGPVSDATQTKACLQDPKLARHSLGHCGYVETLEDTTEMPDGGACKPHSNSEETYDDIEYPGRAGPQSDLSNSFASDNEENNEEMYEEVYKTKSNYPKIDLDGKEALKRLRKFFKKEKDRFKMKKNKLKENVSAFSISLPDLELRSQEAIIYDNVDISEKESRDENKLKTWKPKFLMAKEKKERKGAEESERNFFRTKKQNLEKMRMEKEEKRFREQFEYDKEITVINTAVACSSNSRNGIFDLPITPGEELQVIDTTEENLVICRNSKGKYGYVLIEHLDFKHQGWSP